MNYIAEIAAQIRNQIDPGLLPRENVDQLFLIYAVLVLAKGATTTAEDVHDAWSAWMDGVDPDHESLIPFSELEPDVQAADAPYLDAILRVARATDLKAGSD